MDVRQRRLKISVTVETDAGYIAEVFRLEDSGQRREPALPLLAADEVGQFGLGRLSRDTPT